MTDSHSLALSIIGKAQDAEGRGLWPEHIARRAADCVAREGVAYVSFDAYQRAYRVDPFGPGSWMMRTMIYRLDGTVNRY